MQHNICCINYVIIKPAFKHDNIAHSCSGYAIRLVRKKIRIKLLLNWNFQNKPFKNLPQIEKTFVLHGNGNRTDIFPF